MHIARTIFIVGTAAATMSYFIGTRIAVTAWLFVIEPQRIVGNGWGSLLLCGLIMGAMVCLQVIAASLCSFPLKYFFLRLGDMPRAQYYDWGRPASAHMLILMLITACFICGAFQYAFAHARFIIMGIAFAPIALQFIDTFDPRFEASPGR